MVVYPGADQYGPKKVSEKLITVSHFSEKLDLDENAEVFPMFSNSLKGLACKNFMGEKLSAFSLLLDFSYYFPNTFHLHVNT